MWPFLGQSGDKCGVAAQYRSRLWKSRLPYWWWTMPRYHCSIKQTHKQQRAYCNKDVIPSWPWTLQVFPMRMRNGWAMRLTVVFLEFIWTWMACLAAVKSEAFSSGRALTMASTFRFQTFTSLRTSFQPQNKLVKGKVMLPWWYSLLRIQRARTFLGRPGVNGSKFDFGSWGKSYEQIHLYFIKQMKNTTYVCLLLRPSCVLLFPMWLLWTMVWASCLSSTHLLLSPMLLLINLFISRWRLKSSLF